MNIFERLNRETSNAQIIGAYNIENVSEVVLIEEIIIKILSLKNINVVDVNYSDWMNAYEYIARTIDDVRGTQPHAVLSFWLDD